VTRLWFRTKKKIIIYGGSEERLEFPNDVHILDLEKLEWQQHLKQEDIPWPTKRIGCAGVVIKNKLYVYGGGDYNKQTERYDYHYYEVWSLDLDNFTWTLEPATGSIPNVSVFMNCFVLGHHMVLTDGTKAHFYDTVSKSWTKIDIKGLTPGAGTCVKTEKALYYVGGRNKIKVDLKTFSFLNEGRNKLSA